MRRLANRLSLSGVCTTLILGFAAGCTSRVEGDVRNVIDTAPKKEPEVVVKSPTPVDQKWGTIKGKAVWGEPTIPKPAAFAVPAGDCACAKAGTFSEKFVIDPKTKGVKNVFVWLADTKDPAAAIPIHPDLKELKAKEVVLDQPCCAFEPHALVLRAGQDLLVKNSAPFAHNINVLGNNKLLQPGTEVTFKKLNSTLKPAMGQCNIHGWMNCWVCVFDHPYYALTGEDGTFEIKDAPVGEYRLMVWQEGMGWVVFDNPDKPKDGKLITIKGGETNDLGELRVTKDD
jgi:hypothetical protein